MNAFFGLLVSFLLFGCASAPPPVEDVVCERCPERIVNDFGGHMVVRGPDVTSFEHLEPAKKSIFAECEYKVLELRRDLDPPKYAEDIALSKRAQAECLEKFIPLARKLGYGIAPAKSAAAEVWRLRFEDRLDYVKKPGMGILYKPAARTTTWATLSRFKGSSAEPLSHTVAEAQSVYRDGHHLNGSISLRAASEKEYSHFTLLSKDLLIRAAKPD